MANGGLFLDIDSPGGIDSASELIPRMIDPLQEVKIFYIKSAVFKVPVLHFPWVGIFRWVTGEKSMQGIE